MMRQPVMNPTSVRFHAGLICAVGLTATLLIGGCPIDGTINQFFSGLFGPGSPGDMSPEAGPPPEAGRDDPPIKSPEIVLPPATEGLMLPSGSLTLYVATRDGEGLELEFGGATIRLEDGKQQVFGLPIGGGDAFLIDTGPEMDSIYLTTRPLVVDDRLFITTRIDCQFDLAEFDPQTHARLYDLTVEDVDNIRFPGCEVTVVGDSMYFCSEETCNALGPTPKTNERITNVSSVEARRREVLLSSLEGDPELLAFFEQVSVRGGFSFLASNGRLFQWVFDDERVWILELDLSTGRLARVAAEFPFPGRFGPQFLDIDDERVYFMCFEPDPLSSNLDDGISVLWRYDFGSSPTPLFRVSGYVDGVRADDGYVAMRSGFLRTNVTIYDDNTASFETFDLTGLVDIDVMFVSD